MMILERAIVQQTVQRDGVTVTRECPRPEHVRQMAHRLQRWQGTREGCQLCQADNAVSVRGGKAVCGLCKANMQIRLAGFEMAQRKVVPISRAASETESLSGLAIVFNSLSVDLGGFVERIDPKAVDRTFAEGIDVVQLAHHDTSKPLARLSQGTLRLRKTSQGLISSFDPIDTTDGADMLKNVAAGNVRGQSFGFTVVEDGDDWDVEGDRIVRTVRDARIYETSAVVWPAYRATTLAVGPDVGAREAEQKLADARLRMAR